MISLKGLFSKKNVMRERVQHIYTVPINGTNLELSVIWPSDTESQIKELRFYDSVSLFF